MPADRSRWLLRLVAVLRNRAEIVRAQAIHGTTPLWASANRRSTEERSIHLERGPERKFNRQIKRLGWKPKSR